MNNLDNLSGQASQLGTMISDLVTKYGLKLLGAIVALVIGFWIIKILVNAINKLMTKSNMDPSLSGFFGSMTSMLLKTFWLSAYSE